jgi:hypothetical protein
LNGQSILTSNRARDQLHKDEAVKESPVYKNGGRINSGRRVEKRYKSGGEFGVGGSTQPVTQSTTSLTRIEGIAHPSREDYYLLYFFCSSLASSFLSFLSSTSSSFFSLPLLLLLLLLSLSLLILILVL